MRPAIHDGQICSPICKFFVLSGRHKVNIAEHQITEGQGIGIISNNPPTLRSQYTGRSTYQTVQGITVLRTPVQWSF